jgi:hypothetical protein
VWRDVKMVGARDVINGLFARALVWGDVDPHGGADGGADGGCNRSTCLDVVCMPGGIDQGCPCV